MKKIIRKTAKEYKKQWDRPKVSAMSIKSTKSGNNPSYAEDYVNTTGSNL